MSEQIIIAMSGRKCAGKNTIGRWICHWWCEQQIKVSPSGSALMCGDTIVEQCRQDITLECSFADNLKDFLIDTLGLRREQCYGNDDDKNSPTEYSWDNTSPFLAWKFGTRELKPYRSEESYPPLRSDLSTEDLRHCYYGRGYQKLGRRTGPMTGRDIMQIFGTDLIRETFGNVWAKATIRRIKKAGKPLSVITDNRFPNEIEAVLAEPRGYIIRLTRSPFGNHDIHPSEAALDNFNWTREKCFVLDNAQMTLDEQNEAVISILKQIF